jgi:acetyl esterase/lipase
MVASFGRLVLFGLVLCAGFAHSAATEPVLTRDVKYGADRLQSFDVYAAAGAKGAPIIFMVHGGAWRIGDKTNDRVVDAKVAHWVPKGFVLISANNRLLPDADPFEQARDIADALAFAQQHAAEWGADGARVVLMGHSAGAHLVTLVATSQELRAIPQPWLATISLDTATLDVVETMRGSHHRLYDIAFGRDETFWTRTSPLAQLTRDTSPFLLVCSTRRSDSCPQGDAFAAKAKSLGVRAEVLRKDFSHREINQLLGSDATYTAAVDRFLASVDPTFASRLAMN